MLIEIAMKEIHVHKFGTNLLTNGEGIDTRAVDKYAAGLVDTYGDDQIVVVTSGAVAVGRQLAGQLRGTEHDHELTLPQYAAIGQSAMFRVWEEAFAGRGVLAASAAVTHRQLDMIDPEEKKVFSEFVSDNGRAGIVTTINESDTLSVKELMKLYTGGENDGLGAHVAWAFGAHSLYLWKKHGGFCDDNGQLVEVIDHSNVHQIQASAFLRSKSSHGRGGILAGIEAGWEAAIHGVPHVQMAAITPDMTGEQVTRFVVG